MKFEDAGTRGLIRDHIPPNHHRDQGEDDIKTKERDIAGAQEETLGPKREV